MKTDVLESRFVVPGISELVAKVWKACARHKSVVWRGAVLRMKPGGTIDGLLKHPDNYQAFDCRPPTLFFTPGKHSGTSGVRVVHPLGEQPMDGRPNRVYGCSQFCQCIACPSVRGADAQVIQQRPLHWLWPIKGSEPDGHSTRSVRGIGRA